MPERITTRLRSALWWLTFWFLTGFLSVHFFLIQLSNMPVSPLKLNMANVLAAYVYPYFAQRWNFFAPQPPERDIFLLARARCICADTGGDEVTTAWTNVTDSLLIPLRKSRFTPLFLVEVGLSNAVIDYRNKLSNDSRATFEKDGQQFIRPVVPADVNPRDSEVMTRTALAALEIQYPHCTLRFVQLGLLMSVYPRFTERHNKDAKVEEALTLIDWQPAQRVSPY